MFSVYLLTQKTIYRKKKNSEESKLKKKKKKKKNELKKKLKKIIRSYLENSRDQFDQSSEIIGHSTQ
jgi:hypothetical protein